MPPAGEIMKKYLREIKISQTEITKVLAAVPTGTEGQQHPLFAKLQTFKTNLDDLASTRLESHAFNMISPMAEIFDASTETVPDFVSDAEGWLQNLSASTLLYI